MYTTLERLNIGCGNDLRAGWVNLDHAHPLADVRHDLTRLPYPFQDNTFDQVLASHVLDHVPHGFWSCPDCHSPDCPHPGKVFFDLFKLIMEELHRITRPNGEIECRYGHTTNTEHWGLDYQHYRLLGYESFNKFTNESNQNYYSHARFRIEEHRITKRRPILYGKLPRINGLCLSEHLKVRIGPPLNRLFCWKPTETTTVLRVLK